MKDTKEILQYIAEAIRQTGNEPHDQLVGYITTGDAAYITRHNNARALIESIDKVEIKQFVKEL